MKKRRKLSEKEFEQEFEVILGLFVVNVGALAIAAYILGPSSGWLWVVYAVVGFSSATYVDHRTKVRLSNKIKS